MSMTIPSVRREQVVRSFSSFSSFSRELQVKYQGHYSAARVQELAKYQRETSNYRAIAVLLLSLLPCIIATTVADVIPLQSPSLGIGRNPGFIARAFITHLIFSFLALTQFRLYVVGLQLSNTRMAIASILASLGTLAGDAALVYTIGFPLPFTFLLNSSVWLVCVLIALAFAGARQVILHDQHRRHFINATKVWSGQFCLVIAWPLYFTALKFTPKSYRPAIMVVLPVFKVLLRLGFSRALPHLRDEGPEIVTFNADMFSSLFMSYMAQSTTLLVTLALIFFDGLRTILFVREILKTYKQVGDLEEALCRVEEESESTTGDGKPTNVSVGMLHRASSILRKLRHEPAATKSFTKSSSKSRRLKLRILLLVQLRRQNTAVIPIPISQQNQSATRFLRIHSKRGIVPVPTRKSSWMENPRASSELPKGARLYIERAQQVLYTMEFIMLLNYVEFAVPAIYGKCGRAQCFHGYILYC